jgi:ribosome-binding factor A
MPQNDPFAGRSKQHVMFAHDVTAANGAEADIAPLSRAGDAIAPTIRHVAQINTPPFGRGLAQHQRRARRRIDLLVVVIFDHFDVVILVERRRDLARQQGEQVHAKAHVAGTHHNRMARCGFDLCKVILGQPGGSDHMHRPRLRREFGKGHCRGGCGKVDHRLGAGETVQRIIRHDDTHRRSTHGRAHILAQPVMASALDRTGKMHPGVLNDLGHQHLPHASGHSGDDNPDFFAHDILRRWISASIAVDPLLGKGRQTAYVPDMSKNRSHISEGPSQRQLRVGELIRRTLADVLARGDIHDPDLNRYSITVGEVRTSPDLRVATAYVVPLGGKGQEDVLDLLHRNRSELRRAVAKNLTLKFSPELRFKLDDTFDRMDDTRRMFEQDNVRRDIES